MKIRLACLLKALRFDIWIRRRGILVPLSIILFSVGCENSTNVVPGQTIHIDEEFEISFRLSERPGLSQSYLSLPAFGGFIEAASTIDLPAGVKLVSKQVTVKYEKSVRATPKYYVPAYKIKVLATIRVERPPVTNQGQVYFNPQLSIFIPEDMKIWPMFHYWDGLKNMEKSDLLLVNLKN